MDTHFSFSVSLLPRAIKIVHFRTVVASAPSSLSSSRHSSPKLDPSSPHPLNSGAQPPQTPSLRAKATAPSCTFLSHSSPSFLKRHRSETREACKLGGQSRAKPGRVTYVTNMGPLHCYPYINSFVIQLLTDKIIK